MTTFGLTDQGFSIPQLGDILDRIVSPLRARFGSSLDFSSQSTEGFLAGIVANAILEEWEILQSILTGLDPDQATGVLLELVTSLTGTFRLGARASSATISICGTPGTTVAAGFSVGSLSTPSIPPFAISAAASIVALSAWSSSTAYSLGAQVTNGGRCYRCTAAGASAVSGGPTTTAVDITDGTAHWTYLGDGTGTVDAVAYCTQTGIVPAVARDLAKITTPVSGVNTAINVADATVGRATMTDQELRVLRAQEIAEPGNGTADATRAALLLVGSGSSNPVTAVTVFVNDGDVANSDGMPPHSIEALVTGGDDQLVANTLWSTVACGCQFTGTTTKTVVDSSGYSQTVKFSRPSAQNLYVVLRLTIYDASNPADPPIVPVYPSDGSTQVKAALAAYGQAQPVARDCSPRALEALAFGIPGVLDVTECLVWSAAIDTSAPAWTASTGYVAGNQVTNDGRQYVCTAPGTSAASGGPSTTGTAITDGTATWRWLGATYAIGNRQIMNLDTSRITVITTPGSP